MFLTTVGLFLLVLGNFMYSILPACLKKPHARLSKILLWNFCIRLLLEAAIETIISTILNLKFGGHFSSKLAWGAFVNHMYAYFFAVVYLSSPLTILAFYGYNFSSLSDPDFSSTWGSLYEGLTTNLGTPLAYPILFLLKRLGFAVLVIFAPDYPTL